MKYKIGCSCANVSSLLPAQAANRALEERDQMIRNLQTEVTAISWMWLLNQLDALLPATR
eukprot:m.5463 g.5463  ORF g.5463 m.5463 type:complete len:60 (-) comp4136_c0_seq1:540-719(-)